MGALKEKITKYGLLGGVFSAIGGLGAFGVCHTICQVLIILLGAIGISVIGMPLAFLQEPRFVAISFGLGGIFFGGALLVYIRHKKGAHLFTAKKLVTDQSGPAGRNCFYHK